MQGLVHKPVFLRDKKVKYQKPFLLYGRHGGGPDTRAVRRHKFVEVGGAEIRRLIYTTNPIEGFNRQLRKITKTKGAFTSEDALEKLIFLALKNITQDWSQSIMSWNKIYLQLNIHFKTRIDAFKF